MGMFNINFTCIIAKSMRKGHSPPNKEKCQHLKETLSIFSQFLISYTKFLELELVLLQLVVICIFNYKCIVIIITDFYNIIKIMFQKRFLI